jgi:hypothetical protein
MRERHARQRPPSHSQLKIGMLSAARIGVWQRGQCDDGTIRFIRRGRR